MINFTRWCPVERLVAVFLNKAEESGAESVTVEGEGFKKVTRTAGNYLAAGAKEANPSLGLTEAEREYFFAHDSEGKATFKFNDGEIIVKPYKFIHGRLLTTAPIIPCLSDADAAITPKGKYGTKVDSSDVENPLKPEYKHQTNGTYCGLNVCYPEAVGISASLIEEVDTGLYPDGEARPCWQLAYTDLGEEGFVFYGPADFPKASPTGKIEVLEAVPAEPTGKKWNRGTTFVIPVADEGRSWWDEVKPPTGQGGGDEPPFSGLALHYFFDPETNNEWPLELCTSQNLEHSQMLGSRLTPPTLVYGLKMVAYFDILSSAGLQSKIPERFIRTKSDDPKLMSYKIPVRMSGDRWLPDFEDSYFREHVEANSTVNSYFESFKASDKGIVLETNDGFGYFNSQDNGASSLLLALAYYFAAYVGCYYTDYILALLSFINHKNLLGVNGKYISVNFPEKGTMMIRTLSGVKPFVLDKKTDSVLGLCLVGYDVDAGLAGDGKQSRWLVAASQGDNDLNCIFDPVSNTAERFNTGDDVSSLLQIEDLSLVSLGG